tara:strand:+ start:5677 stop:6129 length:453 start_codon:yes stop_codon:yes gene_type:complete
MTLIPKQRAQALAGSLHSLIVRQQGGWECEAASLLPDLCAGPLQDAHMIPRQAGHHITMLTDHIDGIRCSWVLCGRHHRRIDTTRPDLWARLAIGTVGMDHMGELAERLEAENPFQGLSRQRWWNEQYASLLQAAKELETDLSTIPKKWR